MIVFKIIMILLLFVGCYVPRTFNRVAYYNDVRCEFNIRDNCGVELRKCSDGNVYICVQNVRLANE